MNYRKGSDVLPARLIEEIQEYVDGGLVYIPKKGNKAGWGHKSGARELLDRRNKEIAGCYEQGESIAELADQFQLSEDAIKKIIYRKK